MVPYDKGLTLLGYSEIPGSGGGWWGGEEEPFSTNTTVVCCFLFKSFFPLKIVITVSSVVELLLLDLRRKIRDLNHRGSKINGLSFL